MNVPYRDAMGEREVLTWTDFGPAARSLAEQVAADDYRPDVILSIARGGLLLAGAISYALDVKNIHVINVKFYTDVNERLDVPIILPPAPSTVDITGLKVLIVDDVADTGMTLQLVREFCAAHVAESRIAVIYEKPRSLVQCEYVWRRTELWINFPWSSEPPVVRSANSGAEAVY